MVEGKPYAIAFPLCSFRIWRDYLCEKVVLVILLTGQSAVTESTPENAGELMSMSSLKSSIPGSIKNCMVQLCVPDLGSDES